MQDQLPVIVDHVSRRFLVPHMRVTTLKSRILGFVRGHKVTYDEFWALRDVSFSVERGDMLGIIGPNGSGKSTMLRIIAGIYRPSSGRVDTHGRVCGLLELGIGFHEDLSGRDNIYLNASLFGLPRKEVEAKYPHIVDFAELGDFIDAPLRTYSTGMITRLAFSIAIQVEADVLLLDEVLAVGDQHFMAKCVDHMERIRKSGTTIIYVSHDLGKVAELCRRAIWLEKGRVVMEGPAEEVAEAYSDSADGGEQS
jgi:lipopolysaccharide transport system ATP-binding protein